MSNPIVSVENPLRHPLTESYLLSKGLEPLIAGNTLTWRFQLVDRATGAAIPLNGRGTMMVKRKDTDDDSAALLARSTTVKFVDNVTYQMAADSDQSVTDDSTAGINTTGCGWLEVRWKPEDEADITAAAGRGFPYDIRWHFADGTERTFYAGLIDALVPITRAIT